MDSPGQYSWMNEGPWTFEDDMEWQVQPDSIRPCASSSGTDLHLMEANLREIPSHWMDTTYIPGYSNAIPMDQPDHISTISMEGSTFVGMDQQTMRDWAVETSNLMSSGQSEELHMFQYTGNPLDFSVVSGSGLLAGIHDVPADAPELPTSDSLFYPGTSAHAVGLQILPSQTAGFVSNDSDFSMFDYQDSSNSTTHQDVHWPHGRHTYNGGPQDHMLESYGLVSDQMGFAASGNDQEKHHQGTGTGRPRRIVYSNSNSPGMSHQLQRPTTNESTPTASASRPPVHRRTTGRSLVPKRPKEECDLTHSPYFASSSADQFDQRTMMDPRALRARRDSVLTNVSAQTSTSAKSKEEATGRSHPYYKVEKGPDNTWPCPFAPDCKHEPAKIKCIYDKYIDSHLKPFACQFCDHSQFSSQACRFRHEREAHGSYGHGNKPYMCPAEGCERGLEGKGFPREYNLRDHMKRVHRILEEPKSKSPSVEPHSKAKAPKLRIKRKNDSGATSSKSAGKAPKIEPEEDWDSITAQSHAQYASTNNDQKMEPVLSREALKRQIQQAQDEPRPRSAVRAQHRRQLH